MKHFLKLNRNKLPFSYGVIALLHLAIVVLSAVILLLIGEPIPKQAPWVALVGIVAGPVVWLFSAYLDWQLKRKRREKVFAHRAVADLRNHGFSAAKTNTKSPWHFSHLLLAGRSRGFWLLVDVLDDEHAWGKVTKKRCIEIRAFVEHRQIPTKTFQDLQVQFEQNHMRFGLRVIKKLIKLDGSGPQTTAELIEVMDAFTLTLSTHGFVPKGTLQSIPVEKAKPAKKRERFYKAVDNEDILMDLISKN